MKELKIRLGRRIRALRKDAGLTQERLGEMSSLSYKYIGEVERGTVNISLESLTRIAETIGISLGKLFDEESHPVRKTIVKKPPVTQALSRSEIRAVEKTIEILRRMTS